MAMPRIEVEPIDDASSKGRGVDGAGCGDGGVPVLELRVGFECDVMRNVIVQAYADGVYRRVGADVADVLEVEAGVVIVDLTTAKEEVGVGMEVYPADMPLWGRGGSFSGC